MIACDLLVLAAALSGGLAMGQAHDHRAPAAAGPASPWSRPVQLGGSGAIGSPGGTHPLALDEIVYAAWVQDGVVHLAKSGDGGATWDHASRITAGGTALYPCSLELAGPALHLVWPDSRNGGWEPYHKRSADGGKTWTEEVRLDPGADLFRLGTAVSGSDVHVVWFNKHFLEKVPAGDQTWTWTWGEVYYSRSTDGGATWEKAIRLTRPDSTACRPVVAASGKFVHVAWVDNRDARQKPGWDWEIYYKRSADGGATWGPDVRMSENEWHSRHPQIMTAGGDRVCCVWEDGAIWDGKTSSGWSGDGALYAGVSDDNGRTWKSPQRITTVNSPDGRATHAKSFAAGSRLFVGWTDAVEGGEHKPIMAEAAYFTMSTDGGLTWSPAERLAAGLPGEWAVDAVAGDASRAIALLSRGDTIHASVRRSPATKARTIHVSPSGDDGNSGAQESPLRTIGRAAEVARAGDVVLVRTGVYKGQVFLRHSGEPGQPIVFKNAPGEKPVVDGEGKGRIELQSEQGWRMPIGWVTVEGFEVRNGWDGIKFYNAHHIVLKGNSIHDNLNQGILGNGHHVRIEGNTIFHNGFKPDNEKSNKEHGIYATGTDFEIVDNVIHSNRAYGIQVAGYPFKADSHAGPEFAGAHRWLIRHNTIAFEQNRSGIVIWQEDATECTIENNIFYRNAVTLGGGDCQGIDFVGAGVGHIIRKNLFFGPGWTSISGKPGNFTASDNLEDKDPLFLDADRFDFRLREGSPAAGFGAAIPPTSPSIPGTAPLQPTSPPEGKH